MKPFSRREFIAAGLAVFSAGLGGKRLVAGRPDSPERYGGFKMGIQSYSLRHYSLADTVAHVADLGLHCVEFYPAHFQPTRDRNRINELKRVLAPADIRLSVHGVNRFNPDERQCRELFAFAKRAGIPVLSADPHPDAFPILHDLVQEYDIRIGIHNHGPGHRYDRATDLLEAVQRWDERIGFCPDTGHSMRSGEDPVAVVRQLRERLYGMHLKDQEAINREEPPETILGDGALDLVALCETLREIGFNEPISLEYELSPEDPIGGIRQGLANFARAAMASS